MNKVKITISISRELLKKLGQIKKEKGIPISIQLTNAVQKVI